jgi:hypothetical protein
MTFPKQGLLNETTITRIVLRMMELNRLVTNVRIRENRIKRLFAKYEENKLFGTCMWQWVKGRLLKMA